MPPLHFSPAYLALLIAVLGTTISPYLFFWQSAHRIEELREEPSGGEEPLPLDERSPGAAQRSTRGRFDMFTGCSSRTS